MYTAAWCKEQEGNKIGVVEVTDAVVDPRTVVVHLHNTPTKRRCTHISIKDTYKR